MKLLYSVQKQKAAVSALIILFLMLFLFLATHYTTMNNQNQETVAANFLTDYGGTEFNLKIANSTESREKGLQNTEELEKDGMIFIYPEEDQRVFWMKNTTISLDIIFLDEKGNVLNIEQADPEPETSKEDLELYESKEPAKYVVEIKQGKSELYNITTDSRLETESIN